MFYIPNEKNAKFKSSFHFDRLLTKLKIINVIDAGSLRLSRNYRAIDYAPGAILFSVPLFGLRIFLLIFIFHFENLSKFIIFSNEDVRRIEPLTNNRKSNYRTTRPARDELPDLRF